MLQPCLLKFTTILQKCKQEKGQAKALKKLQRLMKRSGLNHCNILLNDDDDDDDASARATNAMDQVLIKDLIRSGGPQTVLHTYKNCVDLGIVLPCSLTPRAFGALLKCCAKVGDLGAGVRLHSDIVEQGFLKRDVFLGSAIIDMYAKCGSIEKSQQLFDILPVHDAVSWTALIRGYVEEDLMTQALCCFEAMPCEGVSPDDVTFVSALRACKSIGSMEMAWGIHAQLMKQGMEKDVFVGNTLIDVYAKCGAFSDAWAVFEGMKTRDAVSWNALITGYAENGYGQEALTCFKQMHGHGISPQASTYVSCIKACTSIGICGIAEEMHLEVHRKGIEENLFVGCALVDMYAKLGCLAKAQDVFDKLPERNVVSWTAMIAAYVEHGQFEASIDCFECMQYEGVSAVLATFLSTLKACGAMGVLNHGWKSHAHITKVGLEKELITGSSLVDMYSKHAFLEEAQEVFDELRMQDVVSWTTLIAGYAQIGKSECAFQTFERMVKKGLKPNAATFDNILYSCAHAGLVEKGRMYFECISKEYGIMPSGDHLLCVANLLGRSGDMRNAVMMVKNMPFHPSTSLLHTVMASCKMLGDMDIARQAFDHLLGLDERDASAYVSMSNIYSQTCTHE